MGAHNTVYIIILLPELIQQSKCKTTLPEIAMDY
jgi:hypothetical protein